LDAKTAEPRAKSRPREPFEVVTYSVLQIMPCEPGWYAVFREDDGGEFVDDDEIVMWGLCEVRAELLNPGGERHGRPDRVYRHVCGLRNTEDMGLEPADHVSNFIRYQRRLK